MNKHIDRRDFLKVVGTGTAAASTGMLVGCGDNQTRKAVAQTGHYSGDVPTDKMTYRTTPTHGDKTSLLGYGCMRWPVIKDADGKDIIDQEAVNELVDYALAHGVNYFDTAPVYVRAQSEKATGIALKRHPRDSYYVATKLSNQGLGGKGLSKKEIYDGSVAMYRKSLSELQVDYLDYYLLHSIGGGSGMELLNERFFDCGVIDFLLKEREAGRIRNLGFSFHGDVKVFDYMMSVHEKYHWDFVLIQLNYVDWKHAGGVTSEYLYNELHKRGIPVAVMEPLLGGRLARQSAQSLAQMKQLRPDDSPASWAFRFVGSLEGVYTILSGMTYMEHLQDNIRSLSPLEPITPEESEILEEIAVRMTSSDFIPCTECQYCMPCPYGVDIPGTFSHYNKLLNDELIAKTPQDPNYREARRAFLVGYDRQVEKLRQASHCIGCNLCLPKCPQRIPIVEQLHKVDIYSEWLRKECKNDFATHAERHGKGAGHGHGR